MPTLKERANSTYKSKVVTPSILILIIRCALSAGLLIFTSIYFSETLEEYEDVFETTWKFADPDWWIMVNLYVACFLLVSVESIYQLCKHIVTWHEVFDEIALMIVASIGAFFIGEYVEGVIVMLLYQIGEIFEKISVNRSKNLIVDTIDMRPKVATLVLPDGTTKEIQASDVKVGDILLVQPHQMFVVDGTLVEGDSFVDEASITGEFAPREVHKDDNVYSGSTNQEGLIKIQATSTFTDSTTSKILKLVMESSEKKSKNEAFIHRFALKYTPCVFVGAILVAVIPSIVNCILNGDWGFIMWEDYVYLALNCLVIACPCALVVSIPLTYFMGITLASRYGIIVKGGEFFDKINNLSIVVFDKTGTLTTGQFSIVKENNEDIPIKKFREYIYVGETLSNHPIANGIVRLYALGISNKKVKNYKEIAGKGISFDYESHHILVGNSKLLGDYNIHHPNVNTGLTILYLAVDKKYHGYVIMDDTPKQSSEETVEELHEHGIKTAILSGAKKVSAEHMANLLGIDDVYSNLMPKDKIKHLEEIMNTVPNYVAYVGDGANDAPAIIRSDVGFAMGSMGSDAAVQNADVVIMNDEPHKILQCIEIANDTVKQMKLIIAIALTIKGAILLAALIMAFIPSCENLPMWVGDLADTGVLIICIITSLLLLARKVHAQ